MWVPKVAGRGEREQGGRDHGVVGGWRGSVEEVTGWEGWGGNLNVAVMREISLHALVLP